jgi:hypothetical protein
MYGAAIAACTKEASMAKDGPALKSCLTVNWFGSACSSLISTILFSRSSPTMKYINHNTISQSILENGMFSSPP